MALRAPQSVTKTDIDFAAKWYQTLDIMYPMQSSCLIADAAQDEADERQLRTFPVASTADCQQCLRDLRAGEAAGRVSALIPLWVVLAVAERGLSVHACSAL